MDFKIPTAIEDGIKNVEGYGNMYDPNAPSHRARGVQFKNIDAIVEDSSLVAIQENYDYILWSILAIITTIMAVKIFRKS